MQGLAEIWRCEAAPATAASSSLCHHCGPHSDSFLVKLVSNHPSPVVYDLLVKLSVTQDTNRLRVSDNMVAQMVKNPLAVQETWFQSLGWEDPLEEGMATHSSILVWSIPKHRGAWQTTVHVVTKSRT